MLGSGRAACGSIRPTARILGRLANHGNGIALIFARTETEAFHRYGWRRATAMLFLRRRLKFCLPDGQQAKLNTGGPSVLIANGLRNAKRLLDYGLHGHFVDLRGRGGFFRRL